MIDVLRAELAVALVAIARALDDAGADNLAARLGILACRVAIGSAVRRPR